MATVVVFLFCLLYTAAIAAQTKSSSDLCWAWAAHLGVSEEERFERLSPIIVPNPEVA